LRNLETARKGRAERFEGEMQLREQRAEIRRRTLLYGRICIDRQTTLDCVVRDLSSRGARLLCRTTGAGDLVRLEIKSANGFKKPARIVWRRLEDCGVEFA